jgi:hypothetical protein
VRCRADLEALTRVITRARSLPVQAPAGDIWPGIALRIGAGPRAVGPHRRQFAFTLPQLVAASLALMVLSGGLVWLARAGGNGTDFPPLAANTTSPPPPLAHTFDEAAEGFQRMFEAGRASIDEDTASALAESLAAVDTAVRECRAALESDPGHEGLRAHLWRLQVVRLDLLRRAAAAVQGAR